MSVDPPGDQDRIMIYGPTSPRSCTGSNLAGCKQATHLGRLLASLREYCQSSAR